MQRRWLWFAGPALLVLVWWVATALQLIRPIFLPPPLEVAKALGRLALAEESVLSRSVIFTLLRVLAGLAVGTAIGLPVGLVLGYFSRLYVVWEVPLDFFRSTPVTALFPFFLLVFGVGDECKITIASWSVGLIMVINTIYGVRGCSRARSMYLKSIGASPWHAMLYHIVPEAAPSIIAGLRISISQAFIVVIVTEMLFGADVGIGYSLYGASLMYRTDEVIALIIVAGLLGYAVNKSAEKVGKYVIFWQ